VAIGSFGSKIIVVGYRLGAPRFLERAGRVALNGEIKGLKIFEFLVDE